MFCNHFHRKRVITKHILALSRLFGYEPVSHAFQYGREFFHGFGPEHGDARGLEIGYALEYGRGGQMAPCVEYAAILVDTLHIDAQLFEQDVNLVGKRQSPPQSPQGGMK